MYSHHVCRLMRRINRVESATEDELPQVFVAEYGASPGRIRVFSPEGLEVGSWTTPGRPVGIDVVDDRVYYGYGNMLGGSIVLCSRTGQIVRSRDLGYCPSGIAALPDCLIATGFWSGGIVQILDRDTLHPLGSLSGGPFEGPADVTYVPERNEFYLVEYLGEFRVMVYDARSKTLKRSWRTGGQAYCAVVHDSCVYVSVTIPDTIEQYTLEGTRTAQYPGYPRVRGLSVAGDELFALIGFPYYHVYVFRLPDMTLLRTFPSVQMYQSYCLRATGSGLPQTAWRAYRADGTTETLGVPDEGVSIPTDDALCDAFAGQGADLACNHIEDMRAALERIAAFAGVTPFVWTRTGEQMRGTACLDADIEEIERAVEIVEAAVL